MLIAVVRTNREHDVRFREQELWKTEARDVVADSRSVERSFYVAEYAESYVHPRLTLIPASSSPALQLPARRLGKNGGECLELQSFCLLLSVKRVMMHAYTCCSLSSCDFSFQIITGWLSQLHVARSVFSRQGASAEPKRPRSPATVFLQICSKGLL